MNKIMKIALIAQGVKEENLDNLMDIFNATGNSTVACEKFLGIYEEPIIPEANIDFEDWANIKFMSYNPYTEEVNVSYNRKETTYSVMNKDLLHETNSKYSMETYCTEKGIPKANIKSEETIKENVSTNTISLSSYLRNCVKEN